MYLWKVTIDGSEAMAGGGPDRSEYFVNAEHPKEAFEIALRSWPRDDSICKMATIEFLCVQSHICDATT